MLVRLNQFMGLAPRLDPHLLPNMAAVVAQNCKMTSGSLKPWKTTLTVATPTKAGTKQTIFLYDSTYWLSWTQDVDVVTGPLANDTYKRLYWTGEGAPKMSTYNLVVNGGTDYPNASLPLGIPAPTTALTAMAAALSEYSDAATYAIGALVMAAGSFVDPAYKGVYSTSSTYAVGNYVTYGTSTYVCNTAITVPEAFTLVHWSKVVYKPVTANSVFRCITAVTTPGAFDLTKWQELTVLDQETRSYVYRYVSTYGEAGPPSPASTEIDVYPGQTVNLTTIGTTPAGGYSIATVGIYRTNTGSAATEYQYVGSVNIGTTTYTDTVTNANLGEVLDSELWDPPPAGLTGLIALPNGSLCGYSGKQLCFSVSYQPHAWPVNQRYPMADTVMGIKAYGMNVLATTAGAPYLITVGNDLASLLPQRLENGYACVSKRGVVDMGYAVAYPEPVGLRVAGVNGVDLITAKILDKDSWQALHPSTISAYYYGGMYVAFTDLGCFTFDSDGNLANVTGVTATAGFHDPATGKLYLAIGSNIVQWDAGATNLTYIWQSRPFQAVRPINMSCAQVLADAYPVTFKLYADGSLKSTKTVTDDNPFRLPGGYRALEFAVRLEGTQNIYDVILAESMAELRAA